MNIASPLTFSCAQEFVQTHPDCRPAMDWMNQFVGAPHPNLGRGGAICPFLRRTLQHGNANYMSLGHGNGSAESAYRKVHKLADHFLQVAPPEEAESALKSLIIFFPKLSADQEDVFIREGHNLLKPYCVERGVMIGEFHSKSMVGSVHNPEFMVMQSPSPFFVIRHMSHHDLMFLNTNKYAPDQKLDFLQNYKKYVGPKLPSRVADRLDTVISTARTESGFELELEFEE